MKRPVLVAAAVLALLLLASGIFVVRALRTVGTPEFEKRLLAEMSGALGTEVRANAMEVSLFRGLRLRGVTLANPSPFEGDLVTADAFRLGYDLWPLLRGRLQIDDLSVEKPAIRLVADARGSYNYERLKVYSSASSSRASSASAGTSLLRELVVDRLAVANGQLVMADSRQAFLRLDDLDFESRLAVGAAGTEGQGRARVGVVSLAEALFLRGVESPITVSKKGLRLEPVRARLADGPVSARIRVDLDPEMRWSLDLEAEGSSLETLLKEAGLAPTASGTVAAKGALSGTGGMPTARGKGNAEVKSCRVRDSAVLKALAVAVQLPELASPRFEECRMEFEVAGGVARTPVLRLRGPALELTGKGTYGLATSGLDYDMTLALSPELLSRIPGNTTRAAFKKREDGFGTLDFGVTGTAADPKVDLVSRLGMSLATEAAKEGLRKLFQRKKSS